MIPPGLEISINALLNNKLRLFLTILGLSMGIASVITVLALNKGADESLKEFFMLKKDWYIIEPDIMNFPDAVLKYDTCETLRKNSRHIEKIVPFKEEIVHIGQARWLNPEKITGTSEDFLLFQEIKEGRFLEKEDILRGKYVCVMVHSELVHNVLDHCFWNMREPVGKKVRAENFSIQLVGILRSDSWGEGFGINDVIMPVTALIRMTGDSSLSRIDVRMNSLSEKVALEEIRNTLKLDYSYKHSYFKITPAGHDLKGRENSVRFSGMILFAAALITILVAGTGIINILMVSVTNRILEIGIRRAVGASRKDILFQFLFEALILCFVSGILGIVTARFSTGGLIKIMNNFGLYSIKLSENFNWTGITIFSLVFSGILGVIFGIYPAFEASKLDVADCLRQGEGEH